MFVKVFILNVLCGLAESSLKTLNATTYDLSGNAIVSSSKVFPYVVAVLNKSSYLCAGALISDTWVLTVADSVFVFRDYLRLIHVRLGSINNKKGGKVLPVKLIEFHPYFDDQKPEYDVALIRLARTVMLSPSLNPVRLQKKPKQIMATHFIVTAWPAQRIGSEEIRKVASIESIQRRRLLQVSHLHPTKPQQCSETLDELDFSKTNIMCLDQGEGADPCTTDAGAPVVLNGILWGVVSSWIPEDCDLLPGPSFVTLVSAPNISSWIHATLRGAKWKQWDFFTDFEYDNYDEED